MREINQFSNERKLKTKIYCLLLRMAQNEAQFVIEIIRKFNCVKTWKRFDGFQRDRSVIRRVVVIVKMMMMMICWSRVFCLFVFWLFFRLYL